MSRRVTGWPATPTGSTTPTATATAVARNNRGRACSWRRIRLCGRLMVRHPVTSGGETAAHRSPGLVNRDRNVLRSGIERKPVEAHDSVLDPIGNHDIDLELALVEVEHDVWKEPVVTGIGLASRLSVEARRRRACGVDGGVACAHIAAHIGFYGRSA